MPAKKGYRAGKPDTPGAGADKDATDIFAEQHGSGEIDADDTGPADEGEDA